MSNTRLKLNKNQAKAKKYPQAELLLFKNYSFPLFMLSSKLLGDILNDVQKTSIPV